MTPFASPGVPLNAPGHHPFLAFRLSVCLSDWRCCIGLLKLRLPMLKMLHVDETFVRPANVLVLPSCPALEHLVYRTLHPRPSDDQWTRGHLRGGTHGNDVPIVKVFKNAYGRHCEPFSDQNAL